MRIDELWILGQILYADEGIDTVTSLDIQQVL